MNKIIKSAAFSAIFVTVLLFSSCDTGNGGDEIPKKTGVLILNEGNFGSGNGSISFYDEKSMTITNNVVQSANGGSEIGATVQSIYQHDGVGYIVCNGPDKIEFINMDDFSYLANPETNLSQPRYMTVVGNKGYITCWGPWDFNDWTLPDSYIAVMDLNTKTIVDSLECGSAPEGIFSIGDYLYIANSFETNITVVNINDLSSSKINLASMPEQFSLDASGTIWVSVSSGLYGINSMSREKTDSLLVSNIDGKIAMDGTGEKLYLLAVEPWDPNKTNSASEVRVFDTKTKTLSMTALITGEDFYGIGYNGTTNKIYVSDSKAFSGPGQIYVYDDQGVKLDEQITSVGPSGFVYK